MLANHDPVFQYYRNEYLQNATTSQLYRAENQQAGQAFTQFTDAVGRSIDVYGQEAKAKYAVLAKDAARYKELTEASEKSLGLLRDQLALIQREVKIRREYQRQVISETEQASTRVTADPAVTAAASRTCNGAASVNDVLEFRAPGTDSSAVLVGELQFDAGDSQPTLVRRERGTDRWIATFAWPAEASEAREAVAARSRPQLNSIKPGMSLVRVGMS